MKRLLLLPALALGLLCGSACAETADEQYVRIYGLIQQADALENSGQPAAALARYREARTALERFQKNYPDWNPKIVNFRLNYLAAKIAAVSERLPAVPAATAPAPSPAPPGAPPSEVALAGLRQQVETLQQQLQQLQTEKGVLELKLREALATRPAAADPIELARAEERIQALLKENELLKTTLERESAKPGIEAAERELARLRTALEETTRKLEDQSRRVEALAAEKRALESRLENLAPKLEALAQLDQLKEARQQAERQQAEQTRQIAALTSEVESLRERLRTAASQTATLETLQAENALLKRQLADAQRAAAQGEELRTRLSAAEARVAALQSDIELLRLEKLALEQRVREARTPGVAPPAQPLAQSGASARTGDDERLRRLENEKAELLRRLELAQARVQVYEARAVPFTAEELALLKTAPVALPVTNVVVGAAATRAQTGPPPGGGQLVLEAQRAFAARRYAEAEEKYQALLRFDENNIFTLGNLAMTRLEQGRLDEAEATLQKALSLAPANARLLALLGYLRFRQQRFDEALDALSRSAALDPDNAEVQNHLGVVLNHKGLRGPAETALRRAIQLDPKFGAAHNNLAVIYATQQPPALELARWHYQRALANGHPRNPELERLFETRADSTRPADR